MRLPGADVRLRSAMRSLQALGDVAGKRVLARVDFNVPLDLGHRSQRQVGLPIAFWRRPR